MPASKVSHIASLPSPAYLPSQANIQMRFGVATLVPKLIVGFQLPIPSSGVPSRSFTVVGVAFTTPLSGFDACTGGCQSASLPAEQVSCVDRIQPSVPYDPSVIPFGMAL